MRRGLLPFAVVVVVAALAGTAASQLLPRGRLHYVDLPVATLPLPAPALPPATPAPAATPLAIVPPAASSAPTVTPPAALSMLESTEEPAVAWPPAAVDPAFLEMSDVGALPRLAADGRTPLHRYARAATAACARPCVGVIVTGLGLSAGISARALALPGRVGLSFSPYADAASWQMRARRSGHEALLDLPLQPVRYPQDDTGPLTVRVATPPDHEPAVLRVLAAGQGYVALAAAAGAFAADPNSFAPIAAILGSRGLGLVELGGSALREPARTGGLPFIEAMGPLDGEAAEGSFAAVEAAARRDGQAMAFAEPTPAGLDRLEAWLATLPARGMELVPPSRLLDPGNAVQTTAGP